MKASSFLEGWTVRLFTLTRSWCVFFPHAWNTLTQFWGCWGRPPLPSGCIWPCGSAFLGSCSVCCALCCHLGPYQSGTGGTVPAAFETVEKCADRRKHWLIGVLLYNTWFWPSDRRCYGTPICDLTPGSCKRKDLWIHQQHLFNDTCLRPEETASIFLSAIPIKSSTWHERLRLSVLSPSARVRLLLLSCWPLARSIYISKCTIRQSDSESKDIPSPLSFTFLQSELASALIPLLLAVLYEFN